MKVKFLSLDNTIKLGIVGFIFFLLLGDVLLPEPLKSASKNTKSAINSVILGIVPSKGFDNPNDRTQEAVDEFNERETGGNKQ